MGKVTKTELENAIDYNRRNAKKMIDVVNEKAAHIAGLMENQQTQPVEFGAVAFSMAQQILLLCNEILEDTEGLTKEDE